jgi:hypothetical protein
VHAWARLGVVLLARLVHGLVEQSVEEAQGSEWHVMDTVVHAQVDPGEEWHDHTHVMPRHDMFWYT